MVGQLVFKGEYLNDKRNGKGEEYYPDGKIKFEGEYYDNKKLRGKYYVNSILEYEGEFLYGKKRNGKGYDEFGNILYELHNGTGKVKEYDYKGKLYYEDEYLNWKKLNKKII